MDPLERLESKIAASRLHVGIIGLGYVGLPLACTFSARGVATLGFDVNPARIADLRDGICHVADVRGEDFRQGLADGTLRFSDREEDLRECDALILCVPTPLDHFRKPDTSFMEAAGAIAARALRPGMLVSLESTTYPTTTEELLRPILESISGLSAGTDFFLCYSPERVDPGNASFKTANTPKVIGGLTPACLAAGRLVYSQAIESLHPVSSPRVAEMVKILENTYRLVNISLVNELALLCTRMHIDLWEAIDAARTKPFGFQAFYPGPGVGGHCIPLDPFYLQHIAKGFDFDLTMIEAAGQINSQMPHKMVVKLAFALNRQRKALNGSRVVFLGVAYKPDIADARESPALEMIDICIHKGCEIAYHDPFVPEIVTEKGNRLRSTALDDGLLSGADCVVVVTNHSGLDYARVFELSPMIVDLRNAIKVRDPKVFRL